MVSNMWTARTRSHQTPPHCIKPPPPPLTPPPTVQITAQWVQVFFSVYQLIGTLTAIHPGRPIGESVVADVTSEPPYADHIVVPALNGLAVVWEDAYWTPLYPVAIHGHAAWGYWEQAYTMLILQPP